VLSTVLRTHLSPDDGVAYDTFVARARGASYAQLRDYAALATGGRPFGASFFLARDGSEPVGAALVLRSRLGVVPLPFVQVERGPVVDDPGRLGEVVAALRRALLRRGVARLVVMPQADDVAHAERALAALGFQPDDDPAGAHVRTLRMPIDAPNEGDVYAGSHRKTLRYELKHAKKLGVVTERARGEATAPFVALVAETMGAQGKPGKSKAFARALAEATASSERVACFLSRDGERVLGGVVVVRTDLRVHLVHGATSLAKRPFSKMGPPLEGAIAWARGHGVPTLDLGGIPRAGDTDPKRAAIADFKFGFSKDVVDLVREHRRWL